MADTARRTADPGVLAVLKELHRRAALKLPISNGAELGEHLGISKQAVSKWRKVPADRVLDIEETLNIPRHVMRPDVFGLPTQLGRGKRDRRSHR